MSQTVKQQFKRQYSLVRGWARQSPHRPKYRQGVPDEVQRAAWASMAPGEPMPSLRERLAEYSFRKAVGWL